MAERRPPPAAPIVDRYGLHAPECECARCVLGFRPTIAQRDLARRNYERAQAAKREAERRATAGPGERKAEKRRAWAEAWRAEEKFTDELIGKLSAPVEQPGTPEELAALRAEFPGLRPRRKDRRR